MYSLTSVCKHNKDIESYEQLFNMSITLYPFFFLIILFLFFLLILKMSLNILPINFVNYYRL